jgi:hypothetical protein
MPGWSQKIHLLEQLWKQNINLYHQIRKKKNSTCNINLTDTVRWKQILKAWCCAFRCSKQNKHVTFNTTHATKWCQYCAFQDQTLNCTSVVPTSNSNGHNVGVTEERELHSMKMGRTQKTERLSFSWCLQQRLIIFLVKFNKCNISCVPELVSWIYTLHMKYIYLYTGTAIYKKHIW